MRTLHLTTIALNDSGETHAVVYSSNGPVYCPGNRLDYILYYQPKYRTAKDVAIADDATVFIATTASYPPGEWVYFPETNC